MASLHFLMQVVMALVLLPCLINSGTISSSSRSSFGRRTASSSSSGAIRNNKPSSSAGHPFRNVMSHNGDPSRNSYSGPSAGRTGDRSRNTESLSRGKKIDTNYKNRVGLFGTRLKARRRGTDPWDNTGMGMVSYASKKDKQNKKNLKKMGKKLSRTMGKNAGSGSIGWGFYDAFDMRHMPYPTMKTTSTMRTTTGVGGIMAAQKGRDLGNVSNRLKAWSFGWAYRMIARKTDH